MKKDGFFICLWPGVIFNSKTVNQKQNAVKKSHWIKHGTKELGYVTFNIFKQSFLCVTDYSSDSFCNNFLLLYGLLLTFPD